MKIVAVTFAAMALYAAVPNAAQAQPGGCLKYGLGGAIIGHFAGGHRWKGAAAGCAAGIARRRYHEAQERHERRPDREYRRERDEDSVARNPRNRDPEETGSVRRRGDFESDGSFLRRN